jgi:hypothetical protein
MKVKRKPRLPIKPIEDRVFSVTSGEVVLYNWETLEKNGILCP